MASREVEEGQEGNRVVVEVERVIRVVGAVVAVVEEMRARVSCQKKRLDSQSGSRRDASAKLCRFDGESVSGTQ